MHLLRSWIPRTCNSRRTCAGALACLVLCELVSRLSSSCSAARHSLCMRLACCPVLLRVVAVFEGATSFDQPVEAWDVSRVKTMDWSECKPPSRLPNHCAQRACR